MVVKANVIGFVPSVTTQPLEARSEEIQSVLATDISLRFTDKSNLQSL